MTTKMKKMLSLAMAILLCVNTMMMPVAAVEDNTSTENIAGVEVEITTTVKPPVTTTEPDGATVTTNTETSQGTGSKTEDITNENGDVIGSTTTEVEVNRETNFTETVTPNVTKELPVQDENGNVVTDKQIGTETVLGGNGKETITTTVNTETTETDSQESSNTETTETGKVFDELVPPTLTPALKNETSGSSNTTEGEVTGDVDKDISKVEEGDQWTNVGEAVTAPIENGKTVESKTESSTSINIVIDQNVMDENGNVIGNTDTLKFIAPEQIVETVNKENETVIKNPVYEGLTPDKEFEFVGVEIGGNILVTEGGYDFAYIVAGEYEAGTAQLQDNGDVTITLTLKSNGARDNTSKRHYEDGKYYKYYKDDGIENGLDWTNENPAPSPEVTSTTNSNKGYNWNTGNKQTTTKTFTITKAQFNDMGIQGQITDIKISPVSVNSHQASYDSLVLRVTELTAVLPGGETITYNVKDGAAVVKEHKVPITDNMIIGQYSEDEYDISSETIDGKEYWVVTSKTSTTSSSDPIQTNISAPVSSKDVWYKAAVDAELENLTGTTIQVNDTTSIAYTQGTKKLEGLKNAEGTEAGTGIEVPVYTETTTKTEESKTETAWENLSDAEKEKFLLDNPLPAAKTTVSYNKPVLPATLPVAGADGKIAPITVAATGEVITYSGYESTKSIADAEGIVREYYEITITTTDKDGNTTTETLTIYGDKVTTVETKSYDKVQKKTVTWTKTITETQKDTWYYTKVTKESNTWNREMTSTNYETKDVVYIEKPQEGDEYIFRGTMYAVQDAIDDDSVLYSDIIGANIKVNNKEADTTSADGKTVENYSTNISVEIKDNFFTAFTGNQIAVIKDAQGNVLGKYALGQQSELVDFLSGTTSVIADTSNNADTYVLEGMKLANGADFWLELCNPRKGVSIADLGSTADVAEYFDCLLKVKMNYTVSAPNYDVITKSEKTEVSTSTQQQTLTKTKETQQLFTNTMEIERVYEDSNSDLQVIGNVLTTTDTTTDSMKKYHLLSVKTESDEWELDETSSFVEHTCVYTSEVTTPATCEGEGVRTYTCSECGDSYTEVIDALGHIWNKTIINEDCTNNGKEILICERDNSHKIENTILAHGHNYVITVHTDATCDADGETVYTCTHDESHTYKITHPAHGHDYDDGVITKEATDTEEGEITYTCSYDATHWYIDPIPAKGHRYDDGVVTTPATCLNEGVKTFTCDCGDSYTESIPATGHDWEITTIEATCTENGKEVHHCKNDSAHDFENIIPAINHDWEITIIEATCTEDGKEVHHCNNDAAHDFENIIPATGHAYDDGVVTKAATATENGEKTYTCANDPTHTYTQVIPATGVQPAPAALIEEEPVPLAANPQPRFGVYRRAAQKAAANGELIIEDEDVPLADAPKTGDESLFLAAMSLASLAGLMVLSRKKEEAEEA